MTEDVRSALERARAWMDAPDVVAVGQGEEDGRPVVSVYVTRSEAAARFPAELDGVPVVVRDSGGQMHVQGGEGDASGPPGA